MRAQWNILCDFDGTVSLQDVTDSLLEHLGRPGWQALEDDWVAGRIGARECMSKQVALLDGDVDALHRVLDAVRIDPAFVRFVAQAERLGIPLSIVSDGLDYGIARILARHGLHHLPIIANRLLRTDAGEWRMASPHARPDCPSGTCKCAVMAQQPPERATLLIGDGRSDFCLAGKADLVFAKDGLLRHCRANGIAHCAITGFDDAIALLPDLAVPATAAVSFPLPVTQRA
ncbi:MULTISPECIES: MtnX-like HAD-IB family phosphatase [Xanthomonas]|uniref:MtnX-like HAD-IB family phosphatase n=1 Tax=Xanthomonas TaxID=338 RepID=UPI001367E49D|nr:MULTISPECIES: MtnX-like HAD-IB family phosphatase [Xanthomonas]MCI2243744.1 MtnX-like HAD-IB family phosphatase [Xanthomonas indica]MXV33698.1 phosphatase [Xanthomonas sp. LMG 8989]UYC10496.1 MtnX-like HAD-IB family phosphatase [Xanthomonas sp. CFBP 8445]